MDEAIEKDNSVRFVDAFADHFDLGPSGFAIAEVEIEGRHSLEAKVFLKLY